MAPASAQKAVVSKGDSPANGASAPTSIVTKGPHTLGSIVRGCKLLVHRPAENEARKAEILAIRDVKDAKQQQDQQANEHEKKTRLEYYVHYVEFNKRLDEWVSGTRLILDKDVEWPVPVSAASTPQKNKNQKSGIASRGSSSPPSTGAASPGGPAPNRKGAAGASTESGSLLRKAALKAASTASQRKRKRAGTNSSATAVAAAAADFATPTTPIKQEGGHMDDASVEEGAATGEEDAEGEIDGDTAVVSVEVVDGDDADADGEPETPTNFSDAMIQGEHEPANFSKEKEIEKLRTSGSMTQSHAELSRVKNLDRIQIGQHEVEAWYFSPYPQELCSGLGDSGVLYICEFCLGYFGSQKILERHRQKCQITHPPGNEIYRHDAFLDHKTLYYDVDPFLFYCMTTADDKGQHLIGYFSKEKESAESYNVACILTLPQYQRMGYGKLLIEFSYELSKKEFKLGSPEKPLSDLGLLSYRAYWVETIVELLLSSQDNEISIDEIANKTAIVHSDVMHTCIALQMLKFYKGSHVLAISDGLIEQHERTKKKKRRKIEPSALIWKPPVFSRDQLRFGF